MSGVWFLFYASFTHPALLVLILGYILCALFIVSYGCDHGTRIYLPLYMLLFAISSHNLHRSILHFLAAL